MRYTIISSDKSYPLGINSIGCSADTDVTRYGPTRRNQYIIHYVTAGCGYYNGNPVHAGEGFLIFPGQLEEYHPNKKDPWEFLWIIAEKPEMGELMKACGADDATQIFRYSFVPEVQELCAYVRLHSGAVCHPLTLIELTAGLMKHHEKRPISAPGSFTAYDYALIAKNQIHECYASHFTVTELAARLGISQPYLYRAFSEAFGCSPKSYLTELRISQAKILLSSTNMSVTEIGAAMGFDDVLLFSKFFRRSTGMSPTAYRSMQNKITERQ